MLLDGELDLLDGQRDHKAGARGPPASALLPLWGRAITVIVWRLLALSSDPRLCADGGDGAEYRVWRRPDAVA